MKKRTKNIFGTIIVIIVVILIAVCFFLGAIVKSSIEKFAPGILGVPVTVDSVHVYPLRGKVAIKNFVIGNPEKFKSEYLFSLGKLYVNLDMHSLSSDTIIIDEIKITAPKITYELSLKGSNIGTLLDNLKPEEEQETKEEKQPEKSTSEKPSKKVIIKHFVLSDGKVNIDITALGGKGAALPLPRIEMSDIGKGKEGGASIVDIINTIIVEISKSVTSVASGAADILGDGAKAAIDLTKKSAAAAGAMAVGSVKIAGDMAGSTVDAAGKAVGATADTAGKIVGDTAHVAGDAAKDVGKEASKAVGKFTGMFKKKSKDEK